MVYGFNNTLNPLWVMRSNTNPGQGVKSHEHNYFTLLLVKRGELKVNVGEKSYHVRAGDTVFIPAYTTHSYFNESNQHASSGEVKFSVRSPRLSTFLSNIECFWEQDDFTAACVNKMLKTSTFYDDAEVSVIATYLEALITHLTEGSNIASRSMVGIVDTHDCTPLTQQIIAYLNEHYAEQINLDEIAEHIGMNKNYVCNAFKRDTGATIKKCLLAIRIRKAAELISYGEYSLSQVSESVGFVNVSHFNRVFTKYTGISPGQYRRAYPIDILQDNVESYFSDIDADPETGRFIYSVLARKRLTMEEIRSKDIDASQDMQERTRKYDELDS